MGPSPRSDAPASVDWRPRSPTGGAVWRISALRQFRRRVVHRRAAQVLTERRTPFLRLIRESPRPKPRRWRRWGVGLRPKRRRRLLLASAMATAAHTDMVAR